MIVHIHVDIHESVTIYLRKQNHFQKRVFSVQTKGNKLLSLPSTAYKCINECNTPV